VGAPRLQQRQFGLRALTVTVFVCAFATYVVTAPPVLSGYEPETAAVTEGLVRTGEFRMIETSPMAAGGGIRAGDGDLVGRVGLPQPLLEAPFYLLGWGLDEVAGGSRTHWYRSWTVLFYNPFVMAFVAALIFLVMVRVRGSTAWALVVAGLFSLASIAWPYARIGLDATVTLGFAIAFLGAVLARESDRLSPWWLAGFGGGLAIAAKPYTLPAVAAIALLLWPRLRASPGERARRLVALIPPVLAWMAAMASYNWARLGSALDAGNAEYELTLAARSTRWGSS
jgi:hypothetical protein